MKSLRKMLRTDASRNFQSPRFYLACLLFTLSRLVVSMPEYGNLFRQGLTSRVIHDGYLYFSAFFLSSPVSGFAIVVTCVPFASSYLEDRRSGFDLYSLYRTKLRTYAASKMLVNGLASFLTAFVGYMMTSLVFVILSQGQAGRLMQGAEYSAIASLAVWQPWVYLLVLSFFNALYCSFWSLLAQLVSAVIANIYLILAVTYAAQLSLSFLPLRALGLVALQNSTALRGGWLSSSNISLVSGFTLNLLQFMVLYAILLSLFIRRVERQYGK